MRLRGGSQFTAGTVKRPRRPGTAVRKTGRQKRHSVIKLNPAKHLFESPKVIEHAGQFLSAACDEEWSPAAKQRDCGNAVSRGSSQHSLSTEFISQNRSLHRVIRGRCRSLKLPHWPDCCVRWNDARSREVASQTNGPRKAPHEKPPATLDSKSAFHKRPHFIEPESGDFQRVFGPEIFPKEFQRQVSVIPGGRQLIAVQRQINRTLTGKYSV